VLTLIQRREVILEVSSSFKLATLNKLKLVQSLDNIENYSLIFTKQEFPVVGSNLLTFEKLRDLSFQMLFKLILEPVIEVFADKNSYGFRKNRSSHQALANLGLHLTSLKNISSSFVLLKGSLSHCSDKSFLRWILQKIPIPVKLKGLLLI
jgi:retron-type reverse transcriptase